MHQAQAGSSSVSRPICKSIDLDLDYYRRLIEQKKSEATARVAQIREKLGTSVQFCGLTHAADFNPPLEQADRWGLNNAQKVALRCDEALRRIGMGIYGICTICRQPIDKRRLEAIPFAPKCISCKSPGDED